MNFRVFVDGKYSNKGYAVLSLSKQKPDCVSNISISTDCTNCISFCSITRFLKFVFLTFLEATLFNYCFVTVPNSIWRLLFFLLFYNMGIRILLLVSCDYFLFVVGVIGSWVHGIPSASFCLWSPSLQRLFVYSFVSFWRCGCLCVCVSVLQIGQLSDLDLRAPSMAFSTNPQNHCANYFISLTGAL